MNIPMEKFKRYILIYLVVTVFIVLILASVSPKEEKAQTAQRRSLIQHELKLAGNDLASPTQRRVTFTLKNFSDTPSNPECDLSVSDDANQYVGTEYITWNTPLVPGEQKYFSELITVTNDGAEHATHAEVFCHDASTR